MATRNRIFVSIAAYRDPELARTVRDLISLAARPQALTVAVFDQSEKPIAPPSCARGAKVIIDHCHPSESDGACWARSRVQQRMDGEDFFFQLDAHHVFKPGWDALLLSEFDACPSAKPVLTSYLPPYEVKRGVPRINAPSATPMHFSHFDHDGVIIYRSYSYLQETAVPPQPARFFSAHFAFARREFVHEVPYDPELYFYGEESTMAARAFTHGFDLFHPGRTIAWHHYLRVGKPRHWDDHAPGKLQGKSFLAKHQSGLAKYRRIFCLLPYVCPKDGLGPHRSLSQYEAMAGVDHYWNVTHPSTVNLQPPPSASSAEWTTDEKLLTKAELCVQLPRLNQVDRRPSSEIHLAVIDATSHDAAAARVTPEGYSTLQKTGWQVSTRYRSAPLRLVVWPLVTGVGWGRKFESHLDLDKVLAPLPAEEVRNGRKPRRRRLTSAA